MIRHSMDNVQTYAMIEENIKELERKVNDSLIAIQHDYKRMIEELGARCDVFFERVEKLDKKLQETDHIGNCQAEMISILCRKINKLERELFQAREAWQNGVEVMINTLQARVTDMGIMLKNSLLCVDNSHSEGAAERIGVAPVSVLNEYLQKELHKNKFSCGEPIHFNVDEIKVESRIHHPSRKHLEGKLREKNERIKELEEQLSARNVECQNALNDVQKRREKVHFLNESWNKCQAEVEQLNERIGVLSECLDRKQKEINSLTFKIEHYQCKKICCLPSDGRYVNDLHTR